MTGRTGYTAVTNGDVPDFGTDITGVYEHFDDLVGESVADAASLPGSGNWTGRTIWVVADESHYVWNGTSWADQSVASSSLYAPLEPSGWEATGDIEVETVGGKKKTTISIILNRASSGVSVPSGSYLSVGAVIPTEARFATGNRYMFATIWTDSAWTAGVVFINMVDGVVSLRAIPSTVTLNTSGFVEINCTYYGS